MATTTSKLGLTLPSANDAADIAVLNSNFQKIDNAVPATGIAPAGHGLGGNAAGAGVPKLSDLKKTGWYRYEWSIEENPKAGYAGLIYVEACDLFVRQDAYIHGYYGTCHCTRHNVTEDGGFTEWEWVNPPMLPGVEYRTTKRWKGVPVYTRLFEYGALPNNTQAGVALGVTDAEHITHIIGRYASSGGNTTSYPPPGAQVNAWGNSIYINATGNLSSWSAQFTIEYIKT